MLLPYDVESSIVGCSIVGCSFLVSILWFPIWQKRNNKLFRHFEKSLLIGVGEGLFENFILPTSPDASPMLPLPPVGMENGRQMGYILWGSYSVLKK